MEWEEDARARAALERVLSVAKQIEQARSFQK
jgi:hypothetical protein